MTRLIAKDGKKASRKQARHSSASSQFVVGRTAFKSISAVEGITLSKRMDADFRRTATMSADQRRSTLASKYGKQ